MCKLRTVNISLIFIGIKIFSYVATTDRLRNFRKTVGKHEFRDVL